MPMPSFYHGSKILKNEHIAKCFIINIFSHSTATLFSARCEPIYIYIGLHLALTEYLVLEKLYRLYYFVLS